MGNNRDLANNDIMSKEEPTLRIYHPTTGEELDPNSVQYQAMCHFLNSDINNPGPSGTPNQQNNDFRQGEHLFGERQRRPVTNHILEGLY